jgi:hypothetical protein
MEPATPLETLCRIILRAREYEAQTPSDYDANETADNVDDEDEGALSVLDDAINDSVEEELRSILEDLGEDQLAEVLAFCWVGSRQLRGLGLGGGTPGIRGNAARRRHRAVIDELLEMPMLPSVLESGLAAFDLNCDGIGSVS